MSLEVILSFFVLMLISIGTYFVSRRLKVPYTVLLVFVGTLIVPLATFPFFAFLKAFQLTPELLFYLFLPILIFESAYNMRVRDLEGNIRAVSWLSVGSLLISMFFIAFALQFVLWLIGMEVPFMATLLFGALISATDPVAVLALFKEFGVPRRLTFLFEGESLFNDGTSLAAFLIVLQVILVGFSGVETIVEGVLTFLTMVVGGTAFGLLMGFIFAKLIERVEDNEHIEITLTMLVAHLTFILSEVLSHHLVLFGFEIKFSSIIATVMASMVIGNYGRSKLSVATSHFMDRFWGYFAFLVNSLVFITMGLLFAGLPIELREFILPIILTVLVVMVARAFSIYPIVGWLNWTKKEESIPLSWQHLLAWGSLRGALAVVMVLLIPDTLSLPGWDYAFTVKEFITAITIGCIYFTLFVKALTIGPLIRKFGLDALSPVEQAEYRQSRFFIFTYGIEKLGDFLGKKYVSDAVYRKIEAEVAVKRDHEHAKCEGIVSERPEEFEQALRAYALGIEKHFLLLLFKYREVSEPVYKRILTKLDVQLERVENGTAQIQSLDEEFPEDWFERLVRAVKPYLGYRTTKDEVRTERYMYYRAQEIIARKVLKEFEKLEHRSKQGSDEHLKLIRQVRDSYAEFQADAHVRTEKLVATDPDFYSAIDEAFGRQSLIKAFEEGLSGLTEKNMLSPKLAVLLGQEFSREA